jgi:signal transduction histidine kinase
MVDSSLIQFRALLARQHSFQQKQHRRLARRIHDDVSQKLTLLALRLSMAGLEKNPPANWHQKCQEWNDMVVDLGSVLRDICDELRPPILDDLGLVAALQWFADSRPQGIVCHVTIPDEPVTLPHFAANELFALCREIVTDVFAAFGVTEMSIDMEQLDGLLQLQLRAQSIKPSSDPMTFHALDPLSVHERLACIDGAAVIEQREGEDFAVTLSVRTAHQAVCTAA